MKAILVKTATAALITTVVGISSIFFGNQNFNSSMKSNSSILIYNGTKTKTSTDLKRFLQNSSTAQEDVMKGTDIRTAMIKGLPVTYMGMKYQRISGIIYRPAKDHKIAIQLELLDKNSNSVTIAPPSSVSLS